jgi:hypothetical protein
MLASGAPLGYATHNRHMKGASALPASGDVYLDVRDEGRAMRVSWHLDGELVVFSMWRGSVCVSRPRW